MYHTLWEIHNFHCRKLSKTNTVQCNREVTSRRLANICCLLWCLLWCLLCCLLWCLKTNCPLLLDLKATNGHDCVLHCLFSVDNRTGLKDFQMLEKQPGRTPLPTPFAYGITQNVTREGCVLITKFSYWNGIQDLN